jgi:hypothetical protein
MSDLPSMELVGACWGLWRETLCAGLAKRRNRLGARARVGRSRLLTGDAVTFFNRVRAITGRGTVLGFARRCRFGGCLFLVKNRRVCAIVALLGHEWLNRPAWEAAFNFGRGGPNGKGQACKSGQ